MNLTEVTLIESIQAGLRKFDAEVSTDRMFSGDPVPPEVFVIRSKNSKEDEPIHIPAGEFLNRLAK